MTAMEKAAIPAGRKLKVSSRLCNYQYWAEFKLFLLYVDAGIITQHSYIFLVVGDEQQNSSRLTVARALILYIYKSQKCLFRTQNLLGCCSIHLIIYYNVKIETFLPNYAAEKVLIYARKNVKNRSSMYWANIHGKILIL